MGLPKAIKELSDSFSYLPGIGPRLSNRIALYLSISNRQLASKLAQSLTTTLDNITECERCSNVTEEKICEICSDETRIKNKILVVENALDLYTIEETDNYKGLYHVLKGVISPVNGIGPEDINLDRLISRLKTTDIEVDEIIFGLNANLEGESTGLYMKDIIHKHNPDIKITRLAKGIPTGGNIEFMSTQTLRDSLNSRSDY
jgi:recombination protein RecR